MTVGREFGIEKLCRKMRVVVSDFQFDAVISSGDSTIAQISAAIQPSTVQPKTRLMKKIFPPCLERAHHKGRSGAHGTDRKPTSLMVEGRNR
jgi:hypothetical protein